MLLKELVAAMPVGRPPKDGRPPKAKAVAKEDKAQKQTAGKSSNLSHGDDASLISLMADQRQKMFKGVW